MEEYRSLFGDEKGAMHSIKEGKITVWEWE